MKFIIKIISSFFFIGYLPLIPGTFGSLAGIGIYMLVKGNLLVYLAATLSVTILGFIVSGPAEEIFHKKDCRYIVIDEVSGMLLSLLFIPYDFRFLIMGFFLFRLMDTLKPFPACRIQKLKGSAGVMLDDVIAAIYTNIMLQALSRLISFKAS